ncbi:MAG: hypothetical protein ABIG73_01550 [Patescibacteria group bacterium]
MAKFRLVFGFILLILFFVALFVGLPYLFQTLKFSSSTFTMPAPWNFNYFYQPASQTYQNQQATGPKVKIGNISGYGNLQISLQSASYESPVNITGWRIKSAQKGETLIGKGINLVQFDSVSSDVWLNGGESADIIAGVSPIATNFRVNICFGGINNLYSLGYASCPAMAMYDLSGLDSSCQDLILRSNSCQAPSDNILNGQSSKCRIWFEKNVNYSACVNQHRNERDFYRGWKIYTGNGNQIFDPLHDKIELRDQAGSLIDSRQY